MCNSQWKKSISRLQSTCCIISHCFSVCVCVFLSYLNAVTAMLAKWLYEKHSPYLQLEEMIIYSLLHQYFVNISKANGDKSVVRSRICWSCSTKMCSYAHISFLDIRQWKWSSLQYTKYFTVYDSGAQIFHKSRKHLRITGARKVTWSKFHIDDP